MKKFSLSSLVAASVLLGSLCMAETAAQHYRHLTGTQIFSAGNTYLETGWYSLDSDGSGDDPDLSNANFVGSYYFGEIGDTWRPFVLGGFGFSKITQDHVDLGSGDLGDVKLDATYAKLGGGINVNPSPETSLILGASGLWMRNDGDYSGTDAAMEHYFGHDSDTALYDLFAGALYHTQINGYKPYAKATLHYLSIDYDFDLADNEGWSTDLGAGVYTPTLTSWMDLPVRAKFYLAATFLDDELSDVTGFDHAYHAGASLLWKVGPLIPIFDNAFKDTELTFNLQGTTGDNDLKGWKASVSFSIAKF